ncbi:hypothetical protein C1645_818621 [Glomus cerebriforme]|uniref:Uncharacterized protein n=1 Tax=Glomus cerebriforme TaxID=658196 RepID=A0A397TC94_9GLOM|nr:hypothetical protein C1645_818621 [Glomus cerebriforme]
MENIDNNEIEWEKTIEYILNRKEGGNDITEMERRNKDIYKSQCPRCNWEPETWMHIWQCEKNETTIQEIIIDEIDKQIKAYKKRGEYQDWKTSKAQGLTEEERNKITVEKYKNQIIIQQLVNRWMGKLIETDYRHQNIWYKTDISDIVNSLYRNN